MAERLAEPAGPKRSAGDLTLSGYEAAWRRDVELTILPTAKPPDANTLDRLPTVPGMGTILSLVRRYDLHDIPRCPRGQAFAASGRLLQGAKGSTGHRAETSGATSGKAPLKGAVSEAAVFCLREQLPGQTCLARVAKHHDKGQALTSLAHQWARAGSYMLKRQVAFAMPRCFHGSGRGVSARDASLDKQRMNLSIPAPLCLHGLRLCTPLSVSVVLLEPWA